MFIIFPSIWMNIKPNKARRLPAVLVKEKIRFLYNHYYSVKLDSKEKGSDDMQAKKIREDIYRITEQIEEIEYLYRIRRLCYWLLYRKC